METRESELLRIYDDDRIRREEIDAIFYDSGRDEDIVFMFFERMDAIFDGISLHLTMSYYYSRYFFSDTILYTFAAKSISFA